MSKIFRNIFFCILVFCGTASVVTAQSWLSQWPKEIVDKANTAQTTNGISPAEKQVVLLCNLARMNGAMFASYILQPFVDTSTFLERNSYLTSLFNDLKNTSELSPLQYNADLMEIARAHAKKMGQKGKTGHDGFNKRYKAAEKEFGMVAENCHYASNDPLIIVIELLIDNKIKKLGHRKNILHPQLEMIGVAIETHKTYGYNCVMSFAGTPEIGVQKRK